MNSWKQAEVLRTKKKREHTWKDGGTTCCNPFLGPRIKNNKIQNNNNKNNKSKNIIKKI